jgi:hypothetical protein
MLDGLFTRPVLSFLVVCDISDLAIKLVSENVRSSELGFVSRLVASIVYEGGKLYPHHNLYFVTSDDWDIHALQAVMRSGIARLFVSLYCTRMRGGYLRFQAQYLRKIRIPKWQDVSVDLRARLAQYAEVNDRHALNEIVSELYGLSPAELKLIEGKKSE